MYLDVKFGLCEDVTVPDIFQNICSDFAPLFHMKIVLVMYNI